MEHQSPTLVDVDGNPLAIRSLLETVVVSNDATVDFTDFPKTRFSRYDIEIDRIIPTVDSVDLYVLFSISGDFKGGANDYKWTVTERRSNAALGQDQDDGDPQIVVNRRAATTRFGNNANEDFDLTFTITNLGASASLPRVRWTGAGHGDSGTAMKLDGMGEYIGTTSGLPTDSGIDGIRFLFSSGLISEGTFRLYGQE